MTIDERLDRLIERHEALAQSLEIMAGMYEKAITNLTGKMTELTAIVKTISIAVMDHERRLDNLENPGNVPPSQN